MREYLARKLHVSWLLAWFALACLAGIALACWLHMPLLMIWGWPVATGGILFIAFVKRTVAMAGVAICAGLLLGLWRGSIEQGALARYTPYYNQPITLQGIVSDDASYGPHGDQRLTLKAVRINGIPLHGQVWVSTLPHTSAQRSDRVTFMGKLSQGFGNLPASMFYARLVRITRPKPGDIGLSARDRFAAGIRRSIPEPQASLAAGYLVGQRSTLPEDLDSQLKIAGLTHAVVASGYNLTILVAIARQLLLGISKYLALLSSAAMVGGFIMMSGLSPSMSRAGLVTSLSLAAWYYGRRVHPFVLLPLAAAITAIFNPAFVWGDVGWYLSFASFTGVIVLAPLVRHRLWPDGRHPGVLRQIIVDTLSAQMLTLPITIFTFGHYSPYALLANVLVLPLVPLTMLLTFVGGLAGLLTPGLATLAGWPATLILRYMTAVVAWVAGLPGAQGELLIGAGIVASSYALLLFAIVLLWRATRHDFRTGETPEET